MAIERVATPVNYKLNCRKVCRNGVTIIRWIFCKLLEAFSVADKFLFVEE